MSKVLSHKEIVLDYLKNNKSISSMEAFDKFGITRLSAVIFDLKKLGNNITSTDVSTKNRYGRVVHYSVYSLV